MEVYEANPKVGNVRNNGPEMLKAAEKAAVDGALPLLADRFAARPGCVNVGNKRDNAYRQKQALCVFAFSSLYLLYLR